MPDPETREAARCIECHAEMLAYVCPTCGPQAAGYLAPPSPSEARADLIEKINPRRWTCDRHEYACTEKLAALGCPWCLLGEPAFEGDADHG